jgi:hypothetical protein
MNFMFVSLQKSFAEILTPTVMVLGLGAFGRGLVHEGGTLIDGISALVKDPKDHSLLSYEHLAAIPDPWFYLL